MLHAWVFQHESHEYTHRIPVLQELHKMNRLDIYLFIIISLNSADDFI
jgi:hypothetical protein